MCTDQVWNSTYLSRSRLLSKVWRNLFRMTRKMRRKGNLFLLSVSSKCPREIFTSRKKNKFLFWISILKDWKLQKIISSLAFKCYRANSKKYRNNLLLSLTFQPIRQLSSFRYLVNNTPQLKRSFKSLLDSCNPSILKLK